MGCAKAQAAACFLHWFAFGGRRLRCACGKKFGYFKVRTQKLRLKRKRDYVLAEVLLAFRYYMGYTLHRIQGKDDDYGLY